MRFRGHRSARRISNRPAKAFAREGARVAITGRNDTTLKAAQKELGRDALVIKADMSRVPEVSATMDRIKKRFDRIDALFVNAGIGRFVPFEAVTEEFFDETMATNLKGAFFTVQKAVPLLSQGAAVVLNASINAAGVAAYFNFVNRIALGLGVELEPERGTAPCQLQVELQNRTPAGAAPSQRGSAAPSGKPPSALGTASDALRIHTRPLARCPEPPTKSRIAAPVLPIRAINGEAGVPREPCSRPREARRSPRIRCAT
ncbi:MAG: SDR family oxidoreductase [Acidobacteria bacterium]|nr:SDR family oxidoreductase [Acidobacteriota bacterium]